MTKNSKIIDIGGGDSFLVDHLLELGFMDLTVLDISESAIERAKYRLGNKAKSVNCVVDDVLDFYPTEKYDFWHDRAAFHFLTENKDIESYVNKACSYINKNGFLMIGTFSEKGPKNAVVLKLNSIRINHYQVASKMNLKRSIVSMLIILHRLEPSRILFFAASENYSFNNLVFLN
jgi:SAM-dependent methyltransferase